MVWTFRILGSLALAANAVVFAYSQQPDAHISMAYTWPLLLLIFPAFGGMILSLIRRAYYQQGGWFFANGGPGSEGINPSFKAIPMAAWFITPIGMAVLFLLLSQSNHAPEGVPSEREGMLVLENHGRVIREISEEEYHQAHAAHVGGFTVIGMIFSWLAASVLWTLPADLRRIDS